MTLQGLRTMILKVTDLQKAKAWYTEFLGVAPYFDQPFYVGFNVGGYEFGLDPEPSGLKQGNNVQTYWGVKNIAEKFKHALKLGATCESEVRDVGEGIEVALFRDPFGNIFGLIHNPHFKGEELSHLSKDV